MVRPASSRKRTSSSLTKARGRCVICGRKGGSIHDFICGDCGDPRETTLFCERCRRRLRLHEEAAAALLREHGHADDDLRGLVFKVTACSRCMGEDETADVSIYRIRMG